MQPTPLDHDRIADLAATAADIRTAREQAAAELRASAVELARRTCSELDAYDLGGRFHVPAGPGETCRVYTICTATWNEGGPLTRLTKRSRRSSNVLVREHNAMRRSVMWHPRKPDALWDTGAPPHIDYGLVLFQYHSVQLASDDVLAQFALDAETILSGVLAMQQQTTNAYEKAAEQADHMLGLLTDTAR